MSDLGRKELLDLLHHYNAYIQEANEDNKYQDGWYPVCIEEFYQNEFQLIERGEIY